MKSLLLMLSLVLLTGCAELSDLRQYKQEQLAKQAAHNEELAKWKAEQHEKDTKAYMEWYNKLSYEEKMNETRWQDEQRKAAQAREDAMLLNYLAITNNNMNAAMDRVQSSFQYRPTPNITPPAMDQTPPYMPRTQRCTSNVFGGQIQTTCR